MSAQVLWPRYDGPGDLAAIEAVPLDRRALPESTYALLAQAAERWPDRKALNVLPEAARWQSPQPYTFGELLTEVHKQANAFHALGIRREDAIALMAPNCAELITATLAAQLAGIAAPISGALGPDHIRELLRRSGARILVAAGPELAPDGWDDVLALVTEGTLEAVLVLRPTGATDVAPSLPEFTGARVEYLSDLAASQKHDVFHGEVPKATDLAAFFHTGGTTGAPKLAAHTQANQVTNAWMLAANTSLDHDAVLFVGLPLFHVNALVVTLLSPLFKGQAVVWAGPLGYREPALYAEFWKIVEHYRIAAMSAVPTVYAVLAQCPVDADISSLRFAMVGASPLPDAVRTGFQTATGVTLVEGYGLTEATCASARSFPATPVPGSVGQRMPYQQIRAIRIQPDGEHIPLAPGDVGVLAVSGPTVFAGYVAGHDGGRHRIEPMGKTTDGWLETGDLGHVDEEGFVYLRGRAKDLIIRGGHNIDPALIEDALLAHPQVTGAAAVGRPDRHAGEVPVAYVTLVPGATADEAELCAWAGTHVAERAAAPKAVHIISQLPVTAVGKPSKVTLRVDAARGELERALAHLDGIRAVRVEAEQGAVAAEIECATAADEKAAAAILSQYAITWRVVIR